MAEVPPERRNVVAPEERVEMLLKAEAAHRLGQGRMERMLDDPTYREYPEFRAALLQKLKELGRIPADKE